MLLPDNFRFLDPPPPLKPLPGYLHINILITHKGLPLEVYQHIGSILGSDVLLHKPLKLAIPALKLLLPPRKPGDLLL